VRAELETVREQLAQVSAQGLRIANQQRTLERQLQQLSDRQGRLELRGEGRPFEQAIAMLRGGATREELMARLGLSDSEAGLLAQLHAARDPQRDAAEPR
jgi:chromosome segregation ATPase